jgi:hypothetical protein
MMRSDKAGVAVTSEARTAELFLRACAWCRRVEIGNCWLPERAAITALKSYEFATPPSFTHTACPKCFDTLERRRRSGAASPSILTED